ncbi:YciI family protein [Amycolatopsis sp. cmx-8-4]|uniref:YciI family protein n=1 Tax=Amycolatopsis sp. cmx-8-4 TaxID=2790947 RepID=UPI00397E1857
MRFLMMHRLDESAPEAWDPAPEFIEKMGAFIQESMGNGRLITAEGVHPSATGALIRKPRGAGVRGAAVRVTDGPFAEAKEVIGGFALINAEDRADAVEFAKSYAELFEAEVEVEVRQVVEFDEIPG